MQGLGEERTALDPKRSAPDRHETVDKTAVLTALAVSRAGDSVSVSDAVPAVPRMDPPTRLCDRGQHVSNQHRHPSPPRLL